MTWPTPDTTPDCPHRVYAPACPQCTGYVVQGSTLVLSIAAVLLGLECLAMVAGESAVRHWAATAWAWLS